MKHITLRLPVDLHERLIKCADEIGLTVTVLLIISIWRNVLIQEQEQKQ